MRRHATDLTTDRLIIEGSAVLPERSVALANSNDVAAFWLTADNELLRTRILTESRYDDCTATEKASVEKFIGRIVRFNDLIMSTVDALGLVRIEAGATCSTDELMAQCLRSVAR